MEYLAGVLIPLIAAYLIYVGFFFEPEWTMEHKHTMKPRHQDPIYVEFDDSGGDIKLKIFGKQVALSPLEAATLGHVLRMPRAMRYPVVQPKRE